MRNIFLFISIIGLFIVSCNNEPDYPLEPVIEFVNIQKTVFNQDNDTAIITFAFTDGDGNLGNRSDEENVNCWIIDSRTGFESPYKIPFIPQQGAGNGISGEIIIEVRGVECCIDEELVDFPCEPSNTPNAQEPMTYQIQVEDRNGNRSNIIETIPLMLRCN